ncbi:MAG: hypothetical protein ACKOEV_01410 [Cytophagales bacterium]
MLLNSAQITFIQKSFESKNVSVSTEGGGKTALHSVLSATVSGSQSQGADKAIYPFNDAPAEDVLESDFNKKRIAARLLHLSHLNLVYQAWLLRPGHLARLIFFFLPEIHSYRRWENLGKSVMYEYKSYSKIKFSRQPLWNYDLSENFSELGKCVAGFSTAIAPIRLSTTH